MNHQRHVVNLALFMLILVGSLGPGIHEAWALRIPFGDVGALEGAPILNETPAAVGNRVFEKDRVVTDEISALEITTQHGGVMAVGPSSEVLVERSPEQERVTHIRLRRGLLRSVVSGLKAGESYSVETPVAVAGVKGTEFITFSTPWAVSLFTKEGTVGLINASGDTGDSLPTYITQAADDIPPVTLANFETDAGARDLYELVQGLTSLEIPAQFERSRHLPDIIARFNINYASYLLDKGEHDKAALVFELAARFARSEELQAEGIARRVMVEATFLGHLDAALEDADFLVKYYPGTEFYQFALYQRGFIYFEKGEREAARHHLQAYLDAFPDGKFSSSAQTLLNKVDATQ